MTGYIPLHSLRLALATKIFRMECSEADWFFFGVDGDQHIAWMKIDN